MHTGATVLALSGSQLNSQCDGDDISKDPTVGLPDAPGEWWFIAGWHRGVLKSVEIQNKYLLRAQVVEEWGKMELRGTRRCGRKE